MELVLNSREQVITESDEIELMVPVHQPIKCACIISGALISELELVKILSNTVLDITGCMPIRDKEAIAVGMKIKINQLGTLNI